MSLAAAFYLNTSVIRTNWKHHPLGKHPTPKSTIHAGVLPFCRQFFVAAIAASPPPSSRWDINPEIVFRPAAYRNRLWFFTVSVFVRPSAMSCFQASSALTHLFVISVFPSFSTVRNRPQGVLMRRGTSTDCALFSFDPQVSQPAATPDCIFVYLK